jgi:pimeloyl-ACP methyl ester carboxylesterase
MALRAPKRLGAMVLFNTSAARGNPLERAKAMLLTTLLAMGALDKVTGPMIVSGLLAPETQRRDPDLAADLADQFLTWDRRRFVATVRSVLVDRASILDVLSEVTVPALIVSGKDDHTLPSIHSQRMAQQLPNAHHIEASGAAHLVPLEAPDEANPLILDFLRDLFGHSDLRHWPVPDTPAQADRKQQEQDEDQTAGNPPA